MQAFRLSLLALVIAAGLNAPAFADPVASDLFGGASFAEPLGDDELSSYAGMADIDTESNLESDVSENVVGDHVTTGDVSFENSFNANHGIHSSMVNSGNNVSMQSSMTVNVYLD
ncbi:MAG: hypothetical protein AAF430_20530 [Myxococcota bacterium]